MDLYTMQLTLTVALVATACAIRLIYGVGLAIYRFWLGPIAKFPGAKLAALTKWYKCYYEVVRNGQFAFHIQDLHRKYGMATCHPEDNAKAGEAEYG
jgi:hypothetical protein